MPAGVNAEIGKLLVIAGVAIAAVGVALMIGLRAPGLGRLPGDIVLRGRNNSFYFPIVTCLIASAVLTLLLWGISFLLKR